MVILARALGRKASRNKTLPLLDQDLWPRLIGAVTGRFAGEPGMDEAGIERALLEERERLLKDMGLPEKSEREVRHLIRQRVTEQWQALYALLHTHRYLLIAKQSRRLLEKGEPAEVLAFLNESVKKGHDTVEEFVHLGRSLFREGKTAQALQALRQGLQNYPNHPLLTRELALHFRRSGFLQAAVDILSASLEEYDDLQTRKVLGSLYLAQDNAAAAAEVWTDLLHTAPELLDPLEVVQLASQLEDASSPSGAWWKVLEERLVPEAHHKVKGAFEQFLQKRHQEAATGGP